MKFTATSVLALAATVLAAPRPCVPDDPNSGCGAGGVTARQWTNLTTAPPGPPPSKRCVPDDPTSCGGGVTAQLVEREVNATTVQTNKRCVPDDPTSCGGGITARDNATVAIAARDANATVAIAPRDANSTEYNSKRCVIDDPSCATSKRSDNATVSGLPEKRDYNSTLSSLAEGLGLKRQVNLTTSTPEKRQVNLTTSTPQPLKRCVVDDPTPCATELPAVRKVALRG